MQDAAVTGPDAGLASLYRAHLDTMSARLEGALEGTGFTGLVILAGDLQTPARDDVAYPFRVEPHFAAWVPLDRVPGAALVLVPGRKPVLFYPQLEDFWHAPARDPEGFWAEHFDVRVVATAAAATRELRELADGCALIGGAAEGAAGTAAPDLPARADARVLSRLDYARACKTGYEVACLRAANAIAARGHNRVAAAFGGGLSEFELSGLYCDATRQRESELPYQSIVALNEHGAILHYQHLERTAPAQTRSLLIDAGASAYGYAADVTRTWTAAGSPLEPLAASLETLQQTLCDGARRGVDFAALNERAHELLAEVLVEHGIVGCSADDAYDSGLTRTFLPHGLGHLLGLQVHDAGGRQASPNGGVRAPPPEHPFLRLTRVLETGFVVTIEPGVYFIAALLEKLESGLREKVNWPAVEKLLPYGGIRIEDDVLVEAAAPANLTRDAFAACNAA